MTTELSTVCGQERSGGVYALGAWGQTRPRGRPRWRSRGIWDARLSPNRVSKRRSRPDHALDSREPHPDLLPGADPFEDLACLVEQLCSRSVESPDVSVERF